MVVSLMFSARYPLQSVIFLVLLIHNIIILYNILEIYIFYLNKRGKKNFEV